MCIRDRSLDLTLERVRGQVVRIVGSGEEVASGQIPFTPRAKKVLELALRESLSLGHNYVGTEHILLALVRENEGVAVRILLDFDADAERIRGEVIRMLSGPSRQRPVGQTAGSRRAPNPLRPHFDWELSLIHISCPMSAPAMLFSWTVVMSQRGLSCRLRAPWTVPMEQRAYGAGRRLPRGRSHARNGAVIGWRSGGEWTRPAPANSKLLWLPSASAARL